MVQLHKRRIKMDNCIFCKINKGEIPSPKVYEDEDFFIINDINPKAKKTLFNDTKTSLCIFVRTNK